MPKVSICIPAYKQVEYLRKTLISIKEQNFDDYEIIISDDSPSDSVQQLLKEFDFNGKLKYFYNKIPLGSPANWNFAVENASGEYLKILHHDDKFAHKNSLEKFLKMLDENKKSDFAFSATQIMMLHSGIVKKHFCSSSDFKKIQQNPYLLLIKNVIGSPSATIIRKNAFVKFNESLKWLVDIDWYINIINNNNSIVFDSNCLIMSIHGTPEQITTTVQLDKKVQLKEHLIMLEKYNFIKTDKNLFLLYQLLFHKYDIHSIDDLNKIYLFNPALKEYLGQAIFEKNRNTFFKKINFWTKKMNLNDYVYLIKKKLK